MEIDRLPRIVLSDTEVFLVREKKKPVKDTGQYYIVRADGRKVYLKEVWLRGLVRGE